MANATRANTKSGANDDDDDETEMVSRSAGASLGEPDGAMRHFLELLEGAARVCVCV